MMKYLSSVLLAIGIAGLLSSNANADGADQIQAYEKALAAHKAQRESVAPNSPLAPRLDRSIKDLEEKIAILKGEKPALTTEQAAAKQIEAMETALASHKANRANQVDGSPLAIRLDKSIKDLEEKISALKK